MTGQSTFDQLLENVIAFGVGIVLILALLMGALQGCDEIRRQEGKQCYEQTRSEECWGKR